MGMGSEVQRRLQQVVAYLKTVVSSDDPLLKALLQRMADESTGPVCGAQTAKKVKRPQLKGNLPNGLNAH